MLQVLVVDDDDASRAALRAAICSFGLDCRTAADGLEAWDLHREARADVILSDWCMPRMDGLELCRRTRIVHGEDEYTYFMFMTALGDKSHFLRGMDAGADDYLVKPIDLDELRARLVSAERVLSLYRRLAEKNTRLRRDSQTAFRLARTDALTGVANRRRLEEELESLWSQTTRYGHRYSLVLCDIDWFKAYNDHFGHLAGDDALRHVARTIQAELRRGDTLYRFGGEEFLVVLPEQHAAEASRVAERLRRAVEDTGLPTPAGNGVVTISIGVAALSASDESVESWLVRADRALYRAKEKGRNRVEVDGPSGPDLGQRRALPPKANVDGSYHHRFRRPASS